MRLTNKKILGTLACAGALTSFLALSNTNQKNNFLNSTITVKASTTEVAANSYGVDVSSFQSSNLSAAAQQGSKFAIVKVSEGTGYRNPNAAGQVSSAKANNMMPMAYHFATFSGNSSAAASEANYAISSAQAVGLSKGSYIACDWEPGDGNVLTGPVASNTAAISTFMSKVQSAGYQPMLYSSASFLKSYVNLPTITNKFPNSIWVAAYPSGNGAATNTANFNYFPSMDGVAIWQFTDNWHGMNVDGNITLVPLSTKSSSQALVTPTQTETVGVKQSVNKNVKINYVPGYSILEWNNVGGHNSANAYLAHGLQVNVVAQQSVNNHVWYQLGNGKWIDSKYTVDTGSAQQITNEQKISGSLTINYVPGYGVRLLDGNGNYMTQYVQHGSVFKVWGQKTINGKLCYRIGTQSQWIPAEYAIY